MYTPEFFDRLCPVLHELVPGFEERRFIFRIFNTEWADLELKQRTHHITTVLHEILPEAFPEASQLIERISQRLRQQHEMEVYHPFMFLVDYIERYGQAHLQRTGTVLKAIP
ncbi:hypothetical protein [Chryseolinea lacunae]|uniref:Uncharacterized protein n=1 Tax=Chryseolinea lacunae TaxID=2801331 RepID=A0ABS1KQM0_9BACT|nr:hypothetical protein [Chryseolinea lacunae]MBL0741736.1 hypothetical protein [Chryseolinea lacunae]